MIGPVAVWGFLGFPGPRELILIALVTLVLYGRSGLQNHRYARLLRPWTDSPRRPTPPRASTKLGDRVYWFLAIVAATAVAAWVVTRMLIVAGPGTSH